MPVIVAFSVYHLVEERGGSNVWCWQEYGGSAAHTAVPADRRLACAPLGSTGSICYLKYLGPEGYQIWDLWDLGTFI